MRKNKAKNKKLKSTMAELADRHVLYEEAVQCTEADVEFLSGLYKTKRGTEATVLREDFCGTAKLCADWVVSNKKRQAYGLDLDQPTLDWGLKHNIGPLKDKAKRVSLLRQDVLAPVSSKADVIAAFNFSYCIFKERKTLLQYFKMVRRGLKKGGGFVLDVHGGTELSEEVVEEKECEGFIYKWEQRVFNVLTNESIRYIHFDFPDGSTIQRAFTYDWRFWGIVELRDIAMEAGFSEIDMYWEGCTDEGEGDGDFKLRRSAENEPSWIAYLAAWK